MFSGSALVIQRPQQGSFITLRLVCVFAQNSPDHEATAVITKPSRVICPSRVVIVWALRASLIYLYVHSSNRPKLPLVCTTQMLDAVLKKKVVKESTRGVYLHLCTAALPLSTVVNVWSLLMIKCVLSVVYTPE